MIPQALSFNPDFADPVDPPPVLFHALRAPCACGRALRDNHYTFFPGSVFVHGVCEVCGPQTAIFAPEHTPEPMPARLARTLHRLVADTARVYGESADAVVESVLDALATEALGTNPATPQQHTATPDR